MQLNQTHKEAGLMSFDSKSFVACQHKNTTTIVLLLGLKAPNIQRDNSDTTSVPYPDYGQIYSRAGIFAQCET